MFVDEQKIGPGVVGDSDVRPAVVVEVRQHHAHTLGFGLAYSRRIAHVGKGAITVVMVELGLLPFVVAGMAVGTIARPAFAAPDIILRRPLDIVGDDEIEPTVLVIVKPSCTG